MDILQPDDGVWLRPNNSWSLSLPERRPNFELQEDVPHDDGAVPEDEAVPPVEVFPPIQEERYDFDLPTSLRVSPILEQAGSSRLRSDRVYVLPQDTLVDQLSPRTRRRASTLHLHPGQEYMRSGIARSLVTPTAPPKPRVPFLKSLEKIILERK